MTGVTTRYDRVVTEALRPLRPLRKRGRNSNGGNETLGLLLPHPRLTVNSEKEKRQPNERKHQTQTGKGATE
jgi:hypothetical protein